MKTLASLICRLKGHKWYIRQYSIPIWSTCVRCDKSYKEWLEEHNEW